MDNQDHIQEGPSGWRGKWAMAGVPHRGWVCVNVEDLGEPAEICEMCETMEIRYLHYMRHPNYPGDLACGEVCAGHMEGDLAAAQRREKTMKGTARRRRNFPGLKSWYRNSQGNLQIKTDWCRVTVFQKSNGWGAVINQPATGITRFTRERFVKLEEAQRAAFDTLQLVKDEASRTDIGRKLGIGGR